MPIGSRDLFCTPINIYCNYHRARSLASIVIAVFPFGLLARSSATAMYIDPGYLLLGSHLILLVGAWIAGRLVVPSLFVGFLRVCFFSFYYHACKSYPDTWCIPSVPVGEAKRFDYGGAAGLASLTVQLIFVNFPAIRYAAEGIYSKRYGYLPRWFILKEIGVVLIIHWLSVQVIDTWCQSTETVYSLGTVLVFVSTTVFGIFMKLWLVDGGWSPSAPIWRERIRVGFVVSGVVLSLLSLAFFPFDNDWLHFVWHVFAFTGPELVLIGCTPAFAVDAKEQLDAESREGYIFLQNRVIPV